MQSQMSDVEWEIRQLYMAIEYYEKAIENTFVKSDVEKLNSTIAELNQQIESLERKVNEQ